MLDFSSLEKAITSLKSAIRVSQFGPQIAIADVDMVNTIRAGVIQNFEFTYELCWKFIKRWLEMNIGSVYVDGVSRKELFRIASEHQLIDDVEKWMEYHESRNETAHSYDADVAQEVFETAIKFLQNAETLLENLKAKNA